jgi:chromosome segregation ATPase
MNDNPTRETPDSHSFEERVFARFDSLDARIDRIEVKVDALDGRLTALEEKIDSRIRETRPIWEAMQADLTNVRDDLATVKGEVKKLNRSVMLSHEDNLRIRGDLRELGERVEKLESQSTP